MFIVLDWLSLLRQNDDFECFNCEYFIGSIPPVLFGSGSAKQENCGRMSNPTRSFNKQRGADRKYPLINYHAIFMNFLCNEMYANIKYV